jgi:WD40 repeat protein
MSTDGSTVTTPYAKLRRRLYSRFPLLGHRIRRHALEELTRDGSASAVRILAEAADRHDDAEIHQHALRTLEKLAAAGNEPACTALCRLVIEGDHPDARAVAVAAGYLPTDPTDQALFLFLAEQWEKYENLDFDHALLRSAYSSADAHVRKRIGAAARRAGRMEWLALMPSGRPGRALSTMANGEWSTTLGVLQRRERWPEAWRLAQNAPPRWSAAICRLLKQSGWLPRPEERKGFTKLTRLAACWPQEDFESYLDCVHVFRAHADEARVLAVDHTGNVLASGSGDGSLKLWRLPSGSPLGELDGHRAPINCLAFGSDTLASAGKDGMVRLWSLERNTDHVAMEAHEGPVQCMAVTPDGGLVATGGADGAIRLWDMAEKAPLRTMDKHQEPIVCLAVTPDGTMLASGGGDAAVRLWSLPNGRLLKTLTGHRDDDIDAVTCLAISPNGELLASGGTDGDIRLWEIPGGTSVESVRGHHGSVTCLAFSPNRPFLASGGADNRIRLWTAPEAGLYRILEGHSGEITALLVSPNSRSLYSASGTGMDRGVRVWSLPEGDMVKGLYGHDRSVRCLAQDRGGRLLVSGGGDGTIRLWKAELTRLAECPAADSSVADLDWVERKLGCPMEEVERAAYEFIAALFRWRRRHDIVVEPAEDRVVPIGEFDIEIGG